MLNLKDKDMKLLRTWFVVVLAGPPIGGIIFFALVAIIFRDLPSNISDFLKLSGFVIVISYVFGGIPAILVASFFGWKTASCGNVNWYIATVTALVIGFAAGGFYFAILPSELPDAKMRDLLGISAVIGFLPTFGAVIAVKWLLL